MWLLLLVLLLLVVVIVFLLLLVLVLGVFCYMALVCNVPTHPVKNASVPAPPVND